MSKRPLTVSITGCLFIVVGCASLAAVLLKFFGQGTGATDHDYPGGLDSALVGALAALAVVGGAFLFRASNWARWLCVVWMGAHVLISLQHSLQQVVVHGVFLAIIVYFLFRAPASAYFRRTTASP
jgi:hypothetical protein